MHHCLAVPEILQEVLDGILASNERPRESYRTLLALACTCKRFLEPSLDALWRTLDSFLPIFVALGIPRPDLDELIMRGDPYFSTRSRYGGEHNKLLSEVQFKELALRAIIGADYDKAQYHLSRIRVLKLYSIHSAFLWAAAELSRKWGLPLTPNVHELHIQQPLTNDYLAFCGRQLTHISAQLSIDSPSPTRDSYPDFNSIEIRVDISRDTNDLTSSFIKNLPPMRIIDAADCNLMLDAFEVVAAMPSLRCLSIGRFPDLSSSPGFLSAGRFFPCLQELMIGNIHLESCTELLHALEGPNALRQLHVGYLSTTDATLQKFMTTVATRCSPKCLARFTVSSRGVRRLLDAQSYPYKTQPITIQPATLQPLLQFAKLVYLNIDIFTFDYDDGFVESVALAFPNLVSLWLNEHPKYTESSNLTLRCLYPLAKYCPRLEQLEVSGLTIATGPGTIGVDGLSRTWTHDKRYNIAPSLQVRFLCSSEVYAIGKHIPEVATYLMDIFPNIEYVDYDPLYFYIRDAKWHDWDESSDT
ncbi:hypothetical protein EVG20_g5630 [Dentipellis fragilis]|uniref:F-box domain-containing protein n=1 Tax=Dentipellis fragilis TaxID=205917 RepID=A0A4Y9YT41_9AGAM|nr:hypothetical protein EVG20_g5630 [Dentipellis fragilis]